MNKKKLLGAVMTTAIAMTGLCTEISNQVISDSKISVETKNESNDINTKLKQRTKYEAE